MADKAKKIQELAVLGAAANDDLLIIEDIHATSGNANSVTKCISVYTLLANSQVNVVAATLATTHKETPANSTALAIPNGQFFYDNGYFYVATTNNHVKRVALADF